MQAPDLSIVVPCFNEQAVLAELHQRVTATCLPLGVSYELIIVDDGSQDASWEIMRRLSANDSHVVAVRLSRNHGHQLALTAGLTLARGSRILILDGDLQDPPELLPQFMRLMEQGADVVYGKRIRREGEGAFKRTTAFLFYRFIRFLTDTPIPADAGDFRLISRPALDVLLAMPERHRFIRGMVSWIGFRQVPLPYTRHPRFAGETKYPFRSMWRFALDAVTAFSVKPLAMAIWLGLIGSFFSLAVMLWALISWLIGGTVHGWTSLLAPLALIGSIQMLLLGIMGLYLGRLYEQSKGRPLFIVQDIVSSETASRPRGAPAQTPSNPPPA